MEEVLKNYGKPRYGLLGNEKFEFRIVSGIVTGIEFTEGEPIFKLSFDKNTYSTSRIFETSQQLIDSLKLPTLNQIDITHNLSIKYDKQN
jgi:hypothetical protein